MDDDGIPATPEDRLKVAEKILERAAQMGIPQEDVVIDPLVMSVGSDSLAGQVTLRTIELVHEKLGVNINLGASNVSFGLPDRPTVNMAFLALAMGAGATCAITDPMRNTSFITQLTCCWGGMITACAISAFSARCRHCWQLKRRKRSNILVEDKVES
jgi:cobalamin-dependent methionine synthase I